METMFRLHKILAIISLALISRSLPAQTTVFT